MKTKKKNKAKKNKLKKLFKDNNRVVKKNIVSTMI